MSGTVSRFRSLGEADSRGGSRLSVTAIYRPSQPKLPRRQRQRTLETFEPLITASARKHGIADDDMLHAFNHPISYEDLDEGFVMIIGPARSAQLIELGFTTPTTDRSSCMRWPPAEST